MKVRRSSDHIVVRLEKNEEIITALKAVAKTLMINGGFFYGLGVGKKIVLGYFDALSQTYVKKAFEGEYEFTSLQGNIAYQGDEIILHCHATITNSNFNAFGGHLFGATVPATLEVIMFPLSQSLRRFKDTTTGLNLLDI
jgi:predicted DNA-binding protein with PD1-like motif